jgi:hypothetical protein
MLLLIILVCVCCYLKSVERNDFLILGTHPQTLSSREQGCEDPWLFCDDKMGVQARTFGKPGSSKLMLPLLSTTFNNEGRSSVWIVQTNSDSIWQCGWLGYYLVSERLAISVAGYVNFELSMFVVILCSVHLSYPFSSMYAMI